MYLPATNRRWLSHWGTNLGTHAFKHLLSLDGKPPTFLPGNATCHVWVTLAYLESWCPVLPFLHHLWWRVPPKLGVTDCWPSACTGRGLDGMGGRALQPCVLGMLGPKTRGIAGARR